MDDDHRRSTGRKKPRFVPKRPTSSRKNRLADPLPDLNNDQEEVEIQARQLVRQFNEGKARRGPPVERNSSVQVAFGPGAQSLPSLRTFPVNKDGKTADGSIVKHDQLEAGSSDAYSVKLKKDYKEPWDYDHTEYPTTLPWRPPNSGDPEVLDEEEFGPAAREYDENAINVASDLGLKEKSEEKKIIFFQLPANLPLPQRPARGKGIAKAECSTPLRKLGVQKAGLDELSGGYMGKLLVYKSGKVMLKLGTTHFDVFSGSDGSFSQDLVAIDAKEQNCCSLGELGQRAVVAPDISSLFPDLANR